MYNIFSLSLSLLVSIILEDYKMVHCTLIRLLARGGNVKSELFLDKIKMLISVQLIHRYTPVNFLYMCKNKSPYNI